MFGVTTPPMQQQFRIDTAHHLAKDAERQKPCCWQMGADLATLAPGCHVDADHRSSNVGYRRVLGDLNLGWCYDRYPRKSHTL